MNKKVFITRKIPAIGIQKLLDKGYVVDVYEKSEIPSQDELISILASGNYDAALCLLTDKIDARIFDAAPSVKLYVNYATGFDNIDIALAKERGIIVANAPSEFSSEAVAEYTIALMLSLTTRIVEADKFVREGKYAGWAPMNFIGMGIFGKTLGLIGAGRIGMHTARCAAGLGMKVLYTDVHKNEQMEKESGAIFVDTSEEVLQKSDVVSLHVPLLPSTTHLINETRLRLMKPTGFLINTSRGPVIDEKALEKALREKIIAGAALDVFEFEPHVSEGLMELQNVILTPHIASASVEVRNDMAEVASQSIIDFFEGKTPKNIVS